MFFVFPHLIGLPGLLADSLPDKFGNAVIGVWLKKQGRDPDSFTAVERLCYTGSRGMGALEYRPAIGEEAKKTNRLEVDSLRTDALDVYLLGTRIGRIDYSSHHNEMHFAYAHEYLVSADATPLSYSLPLQADTFDSERTTIFFENLLPPDQVRRKLGLHAARGEGRTQDGAERTDVRQGSDVLLDGAVRS